MAMDKQRLRLRTSAMRVRVPMISSRSRTEPLLLHAEGDRLDRVRRVQRIMFRFLSIDVGCKHIEAVAVGSSRPGAPKGAQPPPTPPYVGLGTDRFHLSAHSPHL